MQVIISARSALVGLVLALAFGVQAQDAAEATATATALDEILLKNGSRVLGKVTSSRDGVIVIETDFAGTLSIDSATVDTMRTQGSLVVQMSDGSVIRDQPIKLEHEGMVVTMDSGEQRSYAMADILLLNPEPWELGDGYNATGLVSFAWSLERGNTDTDELDFKLESGWRSLEDRYTIRANGEVDEANDIKSADNWSITGKYDYFLEGDNYWGVRVSAEQDEFADLDLRAYVGPYYGRQFYSEPILSLRGELGVSYVTEDFITAEDQEYPGANWDIHFSSNYLGGDSRLYIDHVGLWNLKDTEDLILNTTFGLSFPLLGQLEAAAEVLLEYDSGAVEDVEELDQTYKLRIGYTW
jgi:hypothetical protein